MGMNLMVSLGEQRGMGSREKGRVKTGSSFLAWKGKKKRFLAQIPRKMIRSQTPGVHYPRGGVIQEDLGRWSPPQPGPMLTRATV